MLVRRGWGILHMLRSSGFRYTVCLVPALFMRDARLKGMDGVYEVRQRYATRRSAVVLCLKKQGQGEELRLSRVNRLGAIWTATKFLDARHIFAGRSPLR